MVDQVQHFDICSVVNNRQTGEMRLKIRMSNGSVSNINMDSEKVEGLCFSLLFPHAEPGYTNACKSRLSPDNYVWLSQQLIQRLLVSQQLIYLLP